VEVDLSRNQLRGKVPVFDGSSNLEVLNLSYNEFSGNLPSDFGARLTSTQIKVLDLKHNQLDGELPSTLGQLPNTLEELDLSHNNLVGTLCESIQSLTHLEGLYLNNNYFVGPIPSSLGHISSLSQLFLQENDFSGILPASLGSLSNLNNLFIDGNKLTGEVPDELCSKSLNKVFQESPGEAREDTRRKLEGCSAIACPAGTSGSEGNCVPCPDRTINPYLGAAKCISTDERDIMTKFMEAAGQPVPTEEVCLWKGVTCNTSGDVTSIVLPESDLKGCIAPELGLLTHLKELNLADNDLEGGLPSELAMAPLETLTLKGNKLVGVVPPKLCEKAGLNGNGSWGRYQCNSVACAVGTFEANQGSGSCIPCLTGSAQYLGSTKCDDGFIKAAFLTTEDATTAVTSLYDSAQYKAGALFGLLLVSFMTMCFLCGGFLLFQRRRKLMTDIHNGQDQSADDFVDPEDEVPTSYKQDSRGTFVTELDQFPTSIQVAKSKNAWSSGKEQQTEVWLDVPKIH